MRMIFRVLFVGLVAVFALSACSGERATTPLPTESPANGEPLESESSAPVQDERSARPQFLNSYASW